jgi:hypothetical protein
MRVTDAKGAPISGVPWEDADLFFLNNALRHGMSVEEVAGFLGRTVDQVRAKTRQMDESLILDDTTSIVPRPPV